MKNIFILMVVAILVSGCAGFMPTTETAAPTQKVFVEDNEDSAAAIKYKELGIIGKLDASGCDIQKFESSESARGNKITIDCK